MTGEMSLCLKCGERKSAEEFYAHRPRRCKKCVNHHYRERYRANTAKAIQRQRDHRKKIGPDRRRKQDLSVYLKRQYGLTLDDYERMLQAQGGVCALCRQPETVKQDGRWSRLSVDHDHETGLIRGLLCRRCNTQIVGGFDTRRDILTEEFFNRLVTYLAREPHVE